MYSYVVCNNISTLHMLVEEYTLLFFCLTQPRATLDHLPSPWSADHPDDLILYHSPNYLMAITLAVPQFVVPC